jgi:hypothetical protein
LKLRSSGWVTSKLMFDRSCGLKLLKKLVEVDRALFHPML